MDWMQLLGIALTTLAGVLLVPYLCWVSFATYLNAGFYWLNRG